MYGSRVHLREHICAVFRQVDLGPRSMNMSNYDSHDDNHHHDDDDDGDEDEDHDVVDVECCLCS